MQVKLMLTNRRAGIAVTYPNYPKRGRKITPTHGHLNSSKVTAPPTKTFLILLATVTGSAE